MCIEIVSVSRYFIIGQIVHTYAYHYQLTTDDSTFKINNKIDNN